MKIQLDIQSFASEKSEEIKVRVEINVWKIWKELLWKQLIWCLNRDVDARQSHAGKDGCFQGKLTQGWGNIDKGSWSCYEHLHVD